MYRHIFKKQWIKHNVCGVMIVLTVHNLLHNSYIFINVCEPKPNQNKKTEENAQL